MELVTGTRSLATMKREIAAFVASIRLGFRPYEDER